MVCPNCGSTRVVVQAVTEVSEKRKKGCLYWLFIGWWWEPLAWMVLGIFKLLHVLFARHTKIVSKTHSAAICQDCGYRWSVDGRSPMGGGMAAPALNVRSAVAEETEIPGTYKGYVYDGSYYDVDIQASLRQFARIDLNYLADEPYIEVEAANDDRRGPDAVALRWNGGLIGYMRNNEVRDEANRHLAKGWPVLAWFDRAEVSDEHAEVYITVAFYAAALEEKKPSDKYALDDIMSEFGL